MSQRLRDKASFIQYLQCSDVLFISSKITSDVVLTKGNHSSISAVLMRDGRTLMLQRLREELRTKYDRWEQ